MILVNSSSSKATSWPVKLGPAKDVNDPNLTMPLAAYSVPQSYTVRSACRHTTSQPKRMLLQMTFHTSSMNLMFLTSSPLHSPPDPSSTVWLSKIPTKLHTHLMHYGDHLAECLQWSSHAKQATTDCTWKNHFIKWCSWCLWLPDLWAADQDLQTRNFILACYAVSLMQGETIHTGWVWYSTLLGYLTQALPYTQSGLPHPWSADVDFIKIITNTFKKYETIRDCQ